jgi:hypothetical protein
MVSTASHVYSLFPPLSRTIEENQISSVILAETGIQASVKLSDKGIRLSLTSRASALNLAALFSKNFRVVTMCANNKFDLFAIPA